MVYNRKEKYLDVGDGGTLGEDDSNSVILNKQLTQIAGK